jgi:uncharacterized paraquat-inducible protein A
MSITILLNTGYFCAELTLVHANVLDAHFHNKCPSDGSELEQIDDPQSAKCPRCGKELNVEGMKPLSASD